MSLRSTQNYTWSKAVLSGMLGALSTIPGAALFVTPKVRLFSGSTVPTGTNAVSDFTQAVYSGYADQVLTVSSVVNVGAGNVAVVASPLFTSPGSGAFTPDTITGYILFNGTTTYYGGERFAQPVPFANFGDFLELTVILPLLLIAQAF